MSLLNLLSFSFFTGVLISFVFSQSVNLGAWLILLALLPATFFVSLDSRMIKGILVLVLYLLGFGWRSFYNSLTLQVNAYVFPIYSPIEKKITDFDEKIFLNLDRSLGQPSGSLAFGMLFGSKGGDFDRRLIRDLRRTGTVHMVAVSGFNVSVLTGILLNTSLLLLNRALILGGVLGLLIYVLLVGFSASVLRAAAMAFYVLAAQLFGRQKNLTDAFLFSASLLLIINPLFLIDLGYQLSFLSLAGVIYLSPIFERLAKGLPKNVVSVVGATIGAQVMILPISAYNFGQISLIAPLANLLTFWTVPLIMLLTSLELLAGAVFRPLALLFTLGNSVLLNFFVEVVSLLSSWSWAAVTF